MTLKIKLSSLPISPESFTQRVTAHVVAMKEYAAHLKGVRLDAEDGELSAEFRRVAFPPPSEEPMIERAAHEGFEFEGPTLAEKKSALFAEVTRMEAEALHAVMPPAKTRHWHFLETDIGVRLAKGIATDEDDAFLTEHKARKAKQQTIARWAAKLEHDIDDLTVETVDAFVLEPFSG